MQLSLYGMSYITISCIFGSSTMLTGGWYIEPKCPLREFVRNIHIWPRLENFNFWGKSQSQLYSIKPERSLIFLLPFEIETNSVDFVLRPKNRRANIVEEGLYRLKPVLRLSTTWSKIARKIAWKIIGYIYRLHNQNVNGKLDFLCCAYLLSLQSEVWQASLKITAR